MEARFGDPKEDGRLHAPVETLWDRVQAWAKAAGHTYDPSFGVVDVGAT